MPVLDNASHETAEDLAVLRNALGPARVAPLHADAMREAAAVATRKAMRNAAARRPRRLVRAEVEGG
ncbi:hypothetical protein [Salinarimonas ramus]|uniref:Uncharacterized protein n=1 Tax=Salinarimonas ramus TaxID=690164 RepID=A0A917QGT4_9HYPH|nr:hypothetical protein [Salinarimonas ramus]GGK48313.1 hypothetical protein GCM10011322_39080 [Salinarimonas ramus]